MRQSSEHAPEPAGEAEMSLALRFAAGSHTGMIRGHNEDSGYAGPQLLAIADGMGGEAAGEVASSEVISVLAGLDEQPPGSDLLSALDDAVQQANARLRAMVERDPQLNGMGTTLSALLWTGQRLGIVHVGDSRAYVLRDGELTQITQDHTWVQRLVDEGRITEEEATTHPQRSLLMRALGTADQVEADLSVREVRAGDRYLVCSDGLSGVVSHETMEESLGAFAPPQDTVRELIELALRGGGPDNITCIVADVQESDADSETATAEAVDDEASSTAPQVVGAVAESSVPDQEAAGTPAARAAGLTKSGRPDGGGQPTQDNGVIGSFGAFTDEAPFTPGRPRRHWLKRTVLILLTLGIVGAALYAGYRWTQSQYFVGANGEHVAVYQGLSDDLGPVSLSRVHDDHPEISLADLPAFQRSEVESTITASDLPQARETVTELHDQAEACRLFAAHQEAAEEDEAEPDGGESAPEAEELPELTETQRQLAGQC